MDLREIGWKDAFCIHLTEDRNQWRAVVNKTKPTSAPRHHLMKEYRGDETSRVFMPGTRRMRVGTFPL
jgi:hypothetical protein